MFTTEISDMIMRTAATHSMKTFYRQLFFHRIREYLHTMSISSRRPSISYSNRESSESRTAHTVQGSPRAKTGCVNQTAHRLQTTQQDNYYSSISTCYANFRMISWSLTLSLIGKYFYTHVTKADKKSDSVKIKYDNI